MAREPSSPKANTTSEPAAERDESLAAKGGSGSARTKRIVTGAAIGIGSAALVAALLYANRSRKQEKGS